MYTALKWFRLRVCGGSKVSPTEWCRPEMGGACPVPGLANPQYIALLFLLDIGLPICQGCEDLGEWVGPWGLCC